MVALTIAAGAYILYLARHLNFFYDEWNFIFDRRGWSLNILLAPHNQHWSTIPVLIFKVLFDVVGLRSYWPYVVVLVVIHLGIAWLLFLLVKRRAGGWVGVGAAALLLVLGRGAENILWAFQAGYDCSILFGLAAMYVGDSKLESRTRSAAVTLLLVASLASSSVGLFFMCALFAEWILDKERRGNLRLMVLPLVIYACWFVLFHAATLPTHVASGGAGGAVAAVASHGLLHIPSGFFHLYTFIPYGIGVTGAALLGLSSGWGGLALICLVAFVLALPAVQKGNRPRVAGSAMGIVTAFALIGLGRAQAGDMEAATSRYLYVGAVFLLLAWPLFLPRSLTVWKRYVLGAVVAVAVVSSAIQLRDFSATKNVAIAREDAELQTVAALRGAADLQMDAVVDSDVMPQVSPGSYFAATDALGSPVNAVPFSGFSSLSSDDVNRALKGMFQKSLTTAPAASNCVVAAATASVDRTGSGVQVDVNSGSNLRVTSPLGATYGVQLWYLSEPSAPLAAEFTVAGGATQRMHIPDTGQAMRWHGRITLKQGGPLWVCGG
jgi:hypothetical protein